MSFEILALIDNRLCGPARAGGQRGWAGIWLTGSRLTGWPT